MTSSTRSARRSERASPDLTGLGADLPPRRLDPAAARAILAGPTLDAARLLVGAILVRDPAAGAVGEPRIARIVEVEAYIGTDDLASHARSGPTPRNEVMFGPAGRAYVYLVYGMYDCLNVVTEPSGRAAAVLIRAAEPLAGLDAMRVARAGHRARRHAAPGTAAAAVATARLASGPGVLCAALSVDRTATGLDLLDPASPLRLELAGEPLPDERIATTPRIGIGYAPEPWRSKPWRFVDRASASVSGPAASGPAARRG